MLSGVFTSGKLKSMTHHIVKAADQMQGRLISLEEEGKDFEVRDLTSTYAMDAFASSGFGIEQDSFKEPDNVFRRMALEMVGAPGYTSGSDQARIMFIMTFPSNNNNQTCYNDLSDSYSYRTGQATECSKLPQETDSFPVRHHRASLPSPPSDWSEEE